MDVASHAGCRRGCTVTQPQQEAGHGVRAAACHFQTGPGYGGQGLPVCGAQLPFEHPAQTAGGRASGQRLGISPGAAVSRRARSRVNAVVPARPLTRAAAEARIRRGRGGRRRATSWRTARAGRGCVGGRWCARRTGGGQPVEVRRKEGVTDHLHPESCAGRCEAAGEALTGARTGGAIEHRKQEFWSAETVTAVEGHTDITATGEGMKGSTVSKNPSTSVRPSPGPGRSSFRPGSRTGAAEERRFRNR